MNLQLVRLYPDIASAADAKKLPPVQQQQLLDALRAYFGKKTSFTAAFRDGECVAEGFRVVEAAHPDVPLYDYWETNADSGSVFLHNTLTSAGVEMIQFDFGVHTDVTNADERLDELVNDFQRATRVTNPADPYVFEEDADGEAVLADFSRPDAAPATRKEWDKLLGAHFVTEGFVRKYEAHFGPRMWWKIYTYTPLSEDYLRTHADQLDWEKVSFSQKLSEPFIREFADRVTWKDISSRQKLSETFIREFAERVDWQEIARNQLLSDGFITEFAHRLALDQLDMTQRSEAFIRAYQDDLDWEDVSEQATLSEAFIREFQERVNWAGIWQYQKVSSAFLIEFADHIEWYALAFNRHLTDEQIRTYAGQLNWLNLIVFGRRISEELICEHESFIPSSAWQHLTEGKRLSPAYRKEIQARLRAAASAKTS